MTCFFVNKKIKDHYRTKREGGSGIRGIKDDSILIHVARHAPNSLNKHKLMMMVVMTVRMIIKTIKRAFL